MSKCICHELHLLITLYFFQIVSCSYSTSHEGNKSKIFKSAAEAVADIPEGAKLLVGGKDEASHGQSFKGLAP